MKNLILVFSIILICFHTQLFSQPCLPEGITFTTQEQIDSFQTNYPNCIEIEGYLKIRGNDITNLDSLNVLTSIGGSLSVGYAWPLGNSNFNLASITGLQNVTSIGGDLIIEGNSVLTSLAGLNNITIVSGDLIIGNGYGFYLFGNPLLNSIAALENLDSIGGYLIINYNSSLIDFTGLNNLTSIPGSLFIWGNDVVCSLTGLDHITYIHGAFEIVGNDSLSDLGGVEELITIGGNLRIANNYNLTSLNGMENVSSIGGDLVIIANYVLSTCDVESICNYLQNPSGSITISSNAPGCNSQYEVEQACETTDYEEIIISDHIIIKPNPFSTLATIEYKLNHPGQFIIEIYNQFGQVVYEFVQQENRTGIMQYTWDASEQPPGLYFIRLRINNKILIRKIVKL